MKERAITTTVQMNRVNGRVVAFAIVAAAGSILIGITTAVALLQAPAHATSLTDVARKPVTSSKPVTAAKGVIKPVTNTVPAVTDPIAPAASPTNPVTPAQTATPEQTPVTATQTPTAAAIENTQTQTSVPSPAATPSYQTTTAANRPPLKEAGDQSVSDNSPISYMSRQINSATAGALYVFAGALGLFGLAVYFATLLPKGQRGRRAAIKNKAASARGLMAVATLDRLKTNKG